MNLTSYRTKLFAYELTRRCSSDSIEKLAGALVDTQVNLIVFDSVEVNINAVFSDVKPYR